MMMRLPIIRYYIQLSHSTSEKSIASSASDGKQATTQVVGRSLTDLGRVIKKVLVEFARYCLAALTPNRSFGCLFWLWFSSSR